MKDRLDDRVIVPQYILKMSQGEIEAKIREFEAKRPILRRSKSESILIGKTKVYIK